MHTNATNTTPPRERFWRQLALAALVILPMKLSANWSREPRPSLIPASAFVGAGEVLDNARSLEPDKLLQQGKEQLNKARDAAGKALTPRR